MPNETMIKLGLLSKKSPAAVESVYNALMDQLKKSNAIYKAYDTIPEANVDAKSKKYGEFMAVFMKELKKKLGIDVKLEVESYKPISESSTSIAVWAVFTWIDRDGRVDDEMSRERKEDFEKEFEKVWGELPEEINTSGFDIEYKMTKEQYVWCYEKYNDLFTFEPEEIVEEVGSVSTASMGSPTTADGSPAPYGSSAIYAQKIGMSSRIKSTKQLKKNKKVRESIEYIDRFLGE